MVIDEDLLGQVSQADGGQDLPHDKFQDAARHDITVCEAEEQQDEELVVRVIYVCWVGVFLG